MKRRGSERVSSLLYMQKKEIVFNVKTLTDLQESSENTDENPQHAYIIKEFVFNCLLVQQKSAN